MMLHEDIQVEEIIARVAAVDIGEAELVPGRWGTLHRRALIRCRSRR